MALFRIRNVFPTFISTSNISFLWSSALIFIFFCSVRHSAVNALFPFLSLITHLGNVFWSKNQSLISFSLSTTRFKLPWLHERIQYCTKWCKSVPWFPWSLVCLICVAKYFEREDFFTSPHESRIPDVMPRLLHHNNNHAMPCPLSNWSSGFACNSTIYSFLSSLHKDVASRASYPTLLEHRFLVHHQQIDTDISEFVASVLDAAGGGGAAGDSVSMKSV